MHRYLYAYGNPTVWIDPTGHAGELAVAGSAVKRLSPIPVPPTGQEMIDSHDARLALMNALIDWAEGGVNGMAYVYEQYINNPITTVGDTTELSSLPSNTVNQSEIAYKSDRLQKMVALTKEYGHKQYWDQEIEKLTADLELSIGVQIDRDTGRFVNPGIGDRERALVNTETGGSPIAPVLPTSTALPDQSGSVDTSPLTTPIRHNGPIVQEGPVAAPQLPIAMWLENSNDVPNNNSKNLLRGDDNPTSSVNLKGRPKSHINTDGDLVPAGNGVHKGRQVQVIEHVLGGYRRGAKSNSDYTSFGIADATAVKYGDSTVTVDLPALRKAIQSGEVSGVAIIPPKRVEKLIQNASGSGATQHWKNKALDFTRSDNEYLIKGKIPSRYLIKSE